MTDLIPSAQPSQALSLVNVGQLMAAAIDKGIDLRELVELHERLKKSAAEEAFNRAMAQFQRECPVIPKSKEGGGGKYWYADLPTICKAIQPTLDACGLTYSWDTQLEDTRLKTTCTITHVLGHSKSASFEAKITSGTQAMNDLQKSASTNTYGQRYSLRYALGISTGETDDDGAGSGKPSPEVPDARSDAKTAPSRADRRPQQKPSVQDPVLAKRLLLIKTVKEHWVKDGGPDVAALVARARQKDAAAIEELAQRFRNFCRVKSQFESLDPEQVGSWGKADEDAMDLVRVHFEG